MSKKIETELSNDSIVPRHVAVGNLPLLITCHPSFNNDNHTFEDGITAHFNATSPNVVVIDATSLDEVIKLKEAYGDKCHVVPHDVSEEYQERVMIGGVPTEVPSYNIFTSVKANCFLETYFDKGTNQVVPKTIKFKTKSEPQMRLRGIPSYLRDGYYQERSAGKMVYKKIEKGS